MTKKSSKRKFIALAILLVIGFFLSFAKFDIPFTTLTYNGFIRAIPLGFDLQGGVSVTYKADLPQDDLTGDLSKNIQATIARIELLLESEGYHEYSVYKQNHNLIRIEVSKLTETEEILSLIEKPLELKITTEQDPEAEAKLTGKHIENATHSAQKNDKGLLQYGVAILFNSEGKSRFAELTQEVYEKGGKLYIYVGNELVTTLSVTGGAITTGQVFFSNEKMTEESAKQMAYKILSGSFKTRLTLLQNTTVSASLGVNALKFGTIAIFVAIALVMILLVVFYKDFGLLADIAISIWAILVMFFLQSVPLVTLSLAGFAGILIGFALLVVGTIVVFEKIKVEHKKGKKLPMSTKHGMKSALPVLADLHVAMGVVSLVLYIVGLGTIKSFALILFIASAVSAFSVMLVLNWLLKIYLPLNSTKPERLSLKKETENAQ